jgi:transposase-like protein
MRGVVEKKTIGLGKGDWGTIDDEFVKRVEEFLKLQSIIIECPECGSSICDWMLDSITTKEENNYVCAKCGYKYTETFEEQDKRDIKNKAAFKAFWADILRI